MNIACRYQTKLDYAVTLAADAERQAYHEQ
jgi:hypothetical protein